MKYDYDIIAIGLGPAGMAVSIMGSAMGLKVCGIERRKIGGECLNIGCIPSKGLLKIAKLHSISKHFHDMGLAGGQKPELNQPFKKIREAVDFINENKTIGMFEKVDLILNEGSAEFVDSHTISAGNRKITAKKIFICTGTRPMIPPIPGIDKVEFLTNENMFDLDEPPKSMTIIGGGPIGCEMGQAFARLGTKVVIAHMDPHLLPVGDEEAGQLLQAEFEKEGIKVYNGVKIEEIGKSNGLIKMRIQGGKEFLSERLLVAAGRKVNLDGLKLENAGIIFTKKGITVDKYLRTNHKHIFAVGDCNGYVLLTHAAMHQGMLALMNAMMPWPFKMNFKKYVVPSTVFTEPEISQVGATEKQLKVQGVKYQVVRTEYADYGRAIADGVTTGFAKVLCSSGGRIYGATIAGESSGEMIHEFAFAMQEKKRMHRIMFLQHSFPTMSFLNKRISETWMMEKMKSRFLRWMCKKMI
jgi:pyruvate/2-oxoglutarate dehydrogenase complex dihydrolipoamide dehydrogenase (E3) component